MTSISRCKDVDVHAMLSMDMKALRFDSVLCIIGKLSSAAYCIRITGMRGHVRYVPSPLPGLLSRSWDVAARSAVRCL